MLALAVVPKFDFDVAVIGGGPSGATIADELAQTGARVLLLDRGDRIKPCGGAIPPRLIRDFAIPDRLLCAKISSARMVSPSGRTVDMQVDDGRGGFVGMVDRAVFDEYLRARAEEHGATRARGSFERIERDTPMAAPTVVYRDDAGELRRVRARVVVGADGALSAVAKSELREPAPRQVFAYHEIVETAPAASADFDPRRCDVIYDGARSPDFYAWVFPHGPTTSIGVGTAMKGFSMKRSVAAVREGCGLGEAKTLRREGAPIPMKPRKRWDNGRDVLVIGDAAGVVAPSSGEGIYYAMVSARMGAAAVAATLETGDARALAGARRAFMRANGRVFFILGVMQYFWYRNDRRRERFVTMCRDPDVQSLTWQAYMNKELVRARPGAHVRIFFRDLAHLLGLSKATS